MTMITAVAEFHVLITNQSLIIIVVDSLNRENINMRVRVPLSLNGFILRFSSKREPFLLLWGRFGFDRSDGILQYKPQVCVKSKL